MEVNNIISYHLYSSYCRTLQYDEYLHRYTFCIEKISDDFLNDLKRKLYIHLNKNLSVEQIRQKVNNLSHEVCHPVFRKESIQPGILFQDIIPGETITFATTTNHRNVELIKLNEDSWLVLKSEDQEYKSGSFLDMDKSESIYDWHDSCEKKFVYSSIYHDTLDKIFLPELYNKTVKSSIAPLYERLNESHNVGLICREWKDILYYAGGLGCGSFVVRRLLDSITEINNDSRG